MTDPATSVTVRDIDIPFSRLVIILLKVMLASLPAIILFYGVLLLLLVAFVAVFGSGAALLNSLGNP